MKEGTILKNADCKMQIAKCVNERGNDFEKCKLQNADCRLQMVKVGSHIYKVQIADCKMQNARLSRGRGGGNLATKVGKLWKPLEGVGKGRAELGRMQISKARADFWAMVRLQIADCEARHSVRLWRCVRFQISDFRFQIELKASQFSHQIAKCRMQTELASILCLRETQISDFRF